MATQGRYFRPKEKHLLGSKWDSELERLIEIRLHTLLPTSQPSGEHQEQPSILDSLKPSENPSSSKSSAGKLPRFDFHADKVPYVIEKTYNPDFTITYPDGREVFVEAKGYFQDAQEIQKYPWIREALKENQELVFCFEKPSKPIHFRSKRKDGTKMSHGEWADKLGFRHFTIETIGELIP